MTASLSLSQVTIPRRKGEGRGLSHEGTRGPRLLPACGPLGASESSSRMVCRWGLPGGPSGPGLGHLHAQAEARLTTGRPGPGDWLCVREDGAQTDGVCLSCYCSYLLLQQLERQ